MSSSRDWSIPLWSDREVNGSIGCDGKREIQGKVKRQRGNDQGITTCQGGEVRAAMGETSFPQEEADLRRLERIEDIPIW